MVVIEGTVNDEDKSPNAYRREQGRATKDTDRFGLFSRIIKGRWRVDTSPITRRIVIFNLLLLSTVIALVFAILHGGKIEYDRSDDMLLRQVTQAAGTLQARLPERAPVTFAADDGMRLSEQLQDVVARSGLDVTLFGAQARILGQARAPAKDPDWSNKSTPLVDLIEFISGTIANLFGAQSHERASPSNVQTMLVKDILDGLGPQVIRDSPGQAGSSLAFAPILQRDQTVAVLRMRQDNARIGSLMRYQQEMIIRVFLIGWAISILLSFIVGSSISSPLSDLAKAAEGGEEREWTTNVAGRVQIPDLTSRTDEIGRLSGAMRSMVAALYDRIDANEQFAADVSHEIKNPLASLRSAVGTLRVAQKVEQRDRLLDVIEHDVRRLDRLVSDISNASRLDSELVKEEQKTFDLIKMMRGLTQYLSGEAEEKDIDFVTDFPPQPVPIIGLEHRLAQVFVNLITNAISFCEEGDAIRIWARARENRVLIVVEDTGPGIPEEALSKIFERFYSHRPANDFGNNSGLGLSISKQIIEAHDGVIWAENIMPTASDPTSDPLGARFVVGLPM